MGNKTNTTVLKSIEKLIVISAKQSQSVLLNELPTFPHGFDGLHIWEAGIILARYIVSNADLFADKQILQLGSGVGIGGITALKYTKCKHCALTDYVPEIVENIKYNCSKNGFKSPLVIKMNWKDYANFDKQYDIVMGSDIVYFGCPVKELYQTIKKSLKSKGIAIIIIPDRKNYAQLFLKEVEESEFDIVKSKLQADIYKESPLANKLQGFSQYSLIQDIDFYVYTLTKKQ